MVIHCEDGSSIDQNASRELVDGRSQSAAEVIEGVAEQSMANRRDSKQQVNESAKNGQIGDT